MGQNPNDAIPDDQPSDGAPAREVRNINAPDLGGSFEENGQTRRHDRVGAAPDLQPVPALSSEQAAQETERNSSAGS